MTTWFPTNHVPLARRTGWTDAGIRSSWLMPLWLRLPFWFVHSLASFVRWTGRCCLYPQGSRDYKASNKVRERSHCKTSWSWDWNLLVACRCIACLRDYSDTHHGGTDGLIRGEPYTLSHVLWPSVMWTNGSIVHGVQTRGARRIVTHAVRRGVVGTWSPAFCLCRTLPSVELRTHISFPGGPGSEHPCWLPATPDASDASDVIQRCPSQVTQDLRWTLLTCIHYTQTISWLEDLLCA